MRELEFESSRTIDSTYEAQDIRADEVIQNYATILNELLDITLHRSEEKFASNVLDIQALDTQASQNTK